MTSPDGSCASELMATLFSLPGSFDEPLVGAAVVTKSVVLALPVTRLIAPCWARVSTTSSLNSDEVSSCTSTSGWNAPNREESSMMRMSAAAVVLGRDALALM